ncbi:hypothetical protein JCM10213_006771 [Rhodosporidiobolus nylandii]
MSYRLPADVLPLLLEGPSPPPNAAFPTRIDFAYAAEKYVNSLAASKRNKAIISPTLHALIYAVLTRPKDTSNGTASERHWAKTHFALDPQHPGAILHPAKNKKQPPRLAIASEVYEIIRQAHEDLGHKGRDKTFAQVKKRFSYVPKELVSRFVRMCPTCKILRQDAKGRPAQRSTRASRPAQHGSSRCNSEVEFTDAATTDSEDEDEKVGFGERSAAVKKMKVLPVMPRETRQAIQQAHEDAGHAGRDKTFALVRQRFSNVAKELVATVVKMCPTCDPYQKHKRGRYGSGSSAPAYWSRAWSSDEDSSCEVPDWAEDYSDDEDRKVDFDDPPSSPSCPLPESMSPFVRPTVAVAGDSAFRYDSAEEELVLPTPPAHLVASSSFQPFTSVRPAPSSPLTRPPLPVTLTHLMHPTFSYPSPPRFESPSPTTDTLPSLSDTPSSPTPSLSSSSSTFFSPEPQSGIDGETDDDSLWSDYLDPSFFEDQDVEDVKPVSQLKAVLKVDLVSTSKRSRVDDEDEGAFDPKRIKLEEC